jgi:hypothetical protein
MSKTRINVIPKEDQRLHHLLKRVDTHNKQPSRVSSSWRKNPLMLPSADLVDDLFFASVWGLKQYGQDLELSPHIPEITHSLVAELASAVKARKDVPSAQNTQRVSKMIDDIIAILDVYSDPDGSLVDDVIDALDAISVGEAPSTEFDPVEMLLYFSPEFRRNRVFDDSVESFLERIGSSAPIGWFVVPSFSGNRSKIVIVLSEEDAQTLYKIRSAIQIELLPIQQNASGFFTYDPDENTSIIGLQFLPSKSRRATNFIETLYLTIAHETIHLLQNQKGLELKLPKSSDYTGLPYSRRKEFLTFDTATAEILRTQLSNLGVDEDLVHMHTLDDIEFYTKLFEEILYFLQHMETLTQTHIDPATSCPLPLDSLINRFIDSRKFFRVLKQFQTDKFEIAVSEFTDAIINQTAMLESLFVCKLRDPQKAIRKLR